MATVVHIPVSEYLRTVYRPDCDYVDGELEERNLGEQTHSLVQAAITAAFYINRRVWGLRALPEQRVQVAGNRYRIPDICVVSADDPIVPILTEAPVLCVEVLSPEDRFQRILTRAQEYQRMGVKHVWIIDPETREAWTMSSGGGPVPLEGDAFTLPGTPVRLTMAEIFEEIDSAPRA
jgi:Uma2 family endonuclease